MHELSIAEELLSIIRDSAEKAGIKRVAAVNLRVGELSSILPESLEFAFRILSRGTITDGARVNIDQVPAALLCARCGAGIGREEGSCGRCGSDEMRVVGGDQLEILSFEGD
jgi:hydrogenase nickel incorporation protein HypA/HybF